MVAPPCPVPLRLLPASPGISRLVSVLRNPIRTTSVCFGPQAAILLLEALLSSGWANPRVHTHRVVLSLLVCHGNQFSASHSAAAVGYCWNTQRTFKRPCLNSWGCFLQAPRGGFAAALDASCPRAPHPPPSIPCLVLRHSRKSRESKARSGHIQECSHQCLVLIDGKATESSRTDFCLQKPLPGSYFASRAGGPLLSLGPWPCRASFCCS